MRWMRVGALLAIFAGVLCTPARAATILFDQSGGFGDAGGSISYGGTGGAMTGSGIGFDQITGQGTNANDGVTLTCSLCTLSFTTGNNTSEGAAIGSSWGFAGGAGTSFVLTGGIPALGVAAGSTILTGTVSGAVALRTGTTALSVTVFGVDTKIQELLDFFDIADPFDYVSTNIEADNASFDNSGANAGAFDAAVIDEADITNTDVVPEPASMALFGLGLLGVGLRMRGIL